MRYLLIKDFKLRKSFKKFEMQQKVKKFIYGNLLSYIFFKKRHAHFYSYFSVLKKKKKRIFTRVVNRCILTNRSKSYRLLKISRIKARELFSFGILPGFKKAVW